MTLQDLEKALCFNSSVLLKNYCTMGIGGPAKYFYQAHTIPEMQQAVIFCHLRNIPFMILGKGSNCLFDDCGFNGAVILNKIDFIEQPTPGTYQVGAGYSFSHLGTLCSRQGFGGLEFASGIPASVGGAIFMNAGANGGETSTFLTSVDYLTETGNLITIPVNEISFSYRFSSFQNLKGAIVGATFTLPKDLSARDRQISIINRRIETQPYNSKSAGCVFLNPECTSAGSLIDQCGLKGLSVGGAEVSTKHANFLINTGNATCKEMRQLIELVQHRIKEAIGIELHSEIRQIFYKN